jgi:hypothetical protein
MARCHELGMLTFDIQAGAAGEYKERAYCFGFMRDRESALRLTEWVSLNTDKYASLVVIQGPVRPDPQNEFVATDEEVALRRTAGNFPVSARGAHIYSRVSPFTTATTRHVAGDDEAPVPPEESVCVDLVWGRRADSADGLFTTIERGLALIQPSGVAIVPSERSLLDMRRARRPGCLGYAASHEVALEARRPTPCGANARRPCPCRLRRERVGLVTKLG